MKNELFLLFVALIASGISSSLGQSADNEDTVIRRSFSQLPAVVTVEGETEETRACGGTLISEHVVITAAQCVHNIANAPRLPVVVLDVLNAHRINRPPETRRTVEAVVHPQYTGDFRDGFDVALLRLHEDTTPLTPVDVRTETVQTGTNLVTIGAAGLAIRIRRSVVLDGAECEEADADFDGESMICISGEIPCEGDEGGPVLDEATGEVVAVVSVTSDCQVEHGHLGIVTLQSTEIADWIETTRAELEDAAQLDSSLEVTAFDHQIGSPTPEPESDSDAMESLESFG